MVLFNLLAMSTISRDLRFKIKYSPSSQYEEKGLMLDLYFADTKGQAMDFGQYYSFILLIITLNHERNFWSAASFLV